MWDTQRNSPAAGRLRAKTGTHVAGDLLNEQYMVNGKGLAGYLETKAGKQIIVAIFANHVPAGADIKAVLFTALLKMRCGLFGTTLLSLALGSWASRSAH